MNLYNKEVQTYLEEHTKDRAEILDKLHRRTYVEMLMPQMISGLVQGNLLTMICKLIKAEQILEVGTFTGYGTICLADGIPDHGQITTVEKNREFEVIAQEHWKIAGVQSKITQVFGDASQVLKELNQEWDLVFIDAAKKYYSDYFDLVLDQLKPGGLILADNVLWSGKVITDPTDPISKQLDRFNKKITADPRVENVILPLRDGIHMIRKK